ncbi:MAG: M20/M25/M40 family metallo-hydrolase [Pyramidobacter sp.]|uniref:M20/M25/M40 family metallo-hydrolase n=1 Tax=Pyramidobacter sp. TaxID=1943581 RepID=UPI002A7FCCD5|nr:M20/M25/M40 family metallo-hydrolase [Pyramidobacter sp.]MDY4031789.1 M20/M25/M40 family metallo-hydrolase [Pyramidobacter sp.]
MNDTDLRERSRAYITENEQRLLDDWLKLVAQPSVSETGEGVEECCAMIVEKMKSIGLDVTKHPVKPYPAIEGRWGNDSKKRTVLIYAHYDVKPAAPLDQWRTPPFEPTIIDGKVYGRGSADNKSPLMAHLEAIDFWLKETGGLPVNVICLFEGCEESGSLGLPAFLAQNRERFKADLVFFSDGPKDPGGLPIIALGCKGSLEITLRVRTMNKNVHSRYAPVLSNAAWRLVELLNKLKTGDTVNVPGFYDNMRAPRPREYETYASMPSAAADLERIYDTKVDTHGREFYDRLNNTPTFCITKINAGANGIVPAVAEVTINVRLVPDQMPDDVFDKVECFIRELGYDDVEITGRGDGTPPSKTDVSTPWLPIIEQATKDIYGEYVIYPIRPSSAPDYLWTNVLGLPAIQVRWSDPDSDNHAPNEKLSIKEYFDGIALTILVLQRIADANV